MNDITPQEAIKLLEHAKTYNFLGHDKICEAIDKGIEAFEKQIPKKPIFLYLPNIRALDEPVKTDMWRCPNCGMTYNTQEHHCFCGQAIDWSEE